MLYLVVLNTVVIIALCIKTFTVKSYANNVIDIVNKALTTQSKTTKTLIEAVEVLNKKVETYQDNNESVQSNLLEISKAQQDHMEFILETLKKDYGSVLTGKKMFN